MNTARYYHTATLLQDGKVLLTGGYLEKQDSENLTDNIELYNFSSETFEEVGKMTSTRYLHRAILLENGNVFITGGITSFNDGQSTLSTANIYVPQ